MDIDITIAENIRALRKKRGFTQGDLADQLGYTVQAISRWEKAKSLPDPITLYKLAVLFGVEVDYFYKQNHIEIDREQEKAIKRSAGISHQTGAIGKRNVPRGIIFRLGHSAGRHQPNRKGVCQSFRQNSDENCERFGGAATHFDLAGIGIPQAPMVCPTEDDRIWTTTRDVVAWFNPSTILSYNSSFSSP